MRKPTQTRPLTGHKNQTVKGALPRTGAAEYLSISTRLLDDLLSNGEIPKIKIGRKTLVRIRDLDDFLAKKLEESK